MGNSTSPLGLLSFLSFAFSIIAAVLAIDMYKLLRTGEFGKSWRLLIIASVMFALLQVLRLAEILNFQAMRAYHLSEVAELCFVIALAYAFYAQRKVFSRESSLEHIVGDDTDEPEYSLGASLEDENEPDHDEDYWTPPSTTEAPHHSAR